MSVFELIVKAENVQEGGGSTSNKVTVEDRSLKGACQNSVVLSTLLLNDHCNYRLCQVIFSITGVVKDWHTIQSRELRSCQKNLEWFYKEFVGGGFYKHVCLTVQTLNSVAALERCGFLTTGEALFVFVVNE